MLIALYFLATKLCELPTAIIAWTIELMPVVIVVAGIMLVCSKGSPKVAEYLGGMGAIGLNGIFSAIGYIAKTAVNAIGWTIRQIIKTIPGAFMGSRRMFKKMGFDEKVSTLLAILVIGLIII